MLSSPGKTFCMKKKGIKGKKWIAAVLLPVFLTAGCGSQGKVETYPDIAEPEAQITFFGNKYEPENVVVIEEILTSFMEENPDIYILSLIHICVHGDNEYASIQAVKDAAQCYSVLLKKL